MSFKPVFSEISPVSKALLFLGLSLVIIVGCYFVGVLFSWLMFDIGPTELDYALSKIDVSAHATYNAQAEISTNISNGYQHLIDSTTNYNLITSLKWFNVWGVPAPMILITLSYFLLFKGVGGKILNKASFNIIKAVLGVLAILLSIPIIDFISTINQSISLPQFASDTENWMIMSEIKAGIITTAFLEMDGISMLLENIVIISLLPAIGEELIFRGILQNQFQKWGSNPHAAIWITALLFSAMHMQFFGFFPRLILGALLGYIYLWSGNIWVSVLVHMANNAAYLIFAYFGLLNEELGLTVKILMSIGCVALIYVSYRLRAKNLNTIELSS